MEGYLVSYRKYRPSTFEEVIGQDDIVYFLKNQVINNKIGNAYLFYGQHGTGKTSTARIFANIINCENSASNNAKMCNNCNYCKNSNELISIFELDAASNNSVEDIRKLIEETKTLSIFCKYKVFIIDEIHMLSQAAFNAFLKTLEEPPKNVIFILATTEIHKVPSTIISRCQRLHFGFIKNDIIEKQLAKILDLEKIKYDKESLEIIAKESYGSMRDALSILDTFICDNKDYLSVKKVKESLNILNDEKYIEILKCMLACDYKNTICTVNNILNTGFDVIRFLNGLLEKFMMLFYIKNEILNNEYLNNINDNIKKYDIKIEKLNNDTISNILNIISETISNYRTTINKKLYITTTLINIINTLKIK